MNSMNWLQGISAVNGQILVQCGHKAGPGYNTDSCCFSVYFSHFVTVYDTYVYRLCINCLKSYFWSMFEVKEGIFS